MFQRKNLLIREAKKHPIGQNLDGSVKKRGIHCKNRSLFLLLATIALSVVTCYFYATQEGLVQSQINEEDIIVPHEEVLEKAEKDFQGKKQEAEPNIVIANVQEEKKKSINHRPSCLDAQTHGQDNPCRFDEIGKYLEESAKFTSVFPQNDAIPETRRIPAEQGNNSTYILEAREKGPDDGSLTPLVDYNPSLLPLTDDLDPVLLDHLTGRYHKQISDEDADRVKYLSVSRSTNFHLCGGSVRRANHTTREHSYMSLALLDDDLKPIPGASASIRFGQAVLPWNCYKRSKMDAFLDFHIIAVRSTKGNIKKDQLFVITFDAPGAYIFPIDIRRVPAPTNDDSDWNTTKIKGKAIPMILESSVGEYDDGETLKFYGSGLQIRLMERRWANGTNKYICTAYFKSNFMDKWKNYHIFDVKQQDGSFDTYMEIRPHNDHQVRKVNFYADHFHVIEDWEFVPNFNIITPSRGGYYRNRTDVIESKEETFKERWSSPAFPHVPFRGTTCCIDLEYGGGKDNRQMVKVGISHTVSREGRIYLSKFYAFETESGKFHTVSVSGLFCLGRMISDDINAESQIFPVAGQFVINEETYDCPVVTFATSLVEYQADPNYVVISYGVNDCYSRSIVVSKERIREFLGLQMEEENETDVA
mmetsp:Transcript_17112/g.22211  ORF Transcript_17112/g.22211 Transcript_17112/m.22211 type:complete len:646 (-) Transcript_17112:105-2042(-)|eukprot:CAMPEP_0116066302 /NCGR_PEP_ID=MMETSP0322-20121206/10297_1 /TAXON_ID=163516 /ORGANISM="Leptocylindrus danicus var. apora, Strain B651" /LENGTH=645 /DNA_ID=CAMNT_0003552821 /DNA_START=83 /DNA_END=2020 /DNA_ORIENTATION=-